MKQGISVLSSLIALLLVILPASIVSAADSCVTSDCHAAIGNHKYVHGPAAAGDCSVCHVSTDATHPGEPGAFKLKETGSRLCEQCHESVTAGKSNVHSPVAKGHCLACHDPHGGTSRFLLRSEGGVLCQSCHSDIGTTGRVHGPVRAGRCDYCHVPHASDGPSLLKAKGNKVCFSCHSGIRSIIETSVSQHQPVEQGRCWDCHRTHDSEFRPLLRGYYPRDFYVSYVEENFELCFECHTNRGTFQYQRTSEATGFRNGDQNLHYLHVNKPVKGRVCRNCHGIHGADQEKLILSRVPGFGVWKIPVRFLPTPTGATCLAGCHKPKSYDRVRAVVNP